MKRRGFTLLEALCTLALVSLIFITVLSLLQDSVRTARMSQEKDTAMNAVQVGLDRLCCEMREAVQVSAPGVGFTLNQITFQKVDSNNPNRLPPRVPEPVPSPAWNPFDPQWLLKVHYFVAGGELVREIGPSAGPATHRSAIAENVDSLSVGCFAPGRFTVVLSVRQSNQISTYTHSVNMPCME